MSQSEVDKIKSRLADEKCLFPGGSQIELEPIEGGLSNILYLINKKYVYRQYLDNQKNPAEILIGRELSSKGLSPKKYKIYEDAQLEEYIPIKPPKHRDFLRSLHKYIPMIREFHKLEIKTANNLESPIFFLLGQWVPKLSEERKEQAYKVLEHPHWDRFKRCFCHNDLHPGNFLGKKMLIDFEYSGMNYQLYDWANLANELELVPQGDHYIHQPNQLVVPFILHASKEKGRDLLHFRNISHLFWACWALEKAKQETGIDFDYQRYAELRFSLIQDQPTKLFELF